MEKEAPNQKNKKKIHQLKPNEFKPKAIKWKKKQQIKKTKKIHHSLKPTDLNQGNKMKKEVPNQKNKKNPSQPKADGL